MTSGMIEIRRGFSRHLYVLISFDAEHWRRIIGTGIFARPGLIAESVGSIDLSLSNYVDFLWRHLDWGMLTLSTAMFKVSYAYAGMVNANTVLNEVSNPIPTLKLEALVAPAALVTATSLYLLINIAYFCVIPLDDIKRSGEIIAAFFLRRCFGFGLGNVTLPLAIAISSAGNDRSFRSQRLTKTFQILDICGVDIDHFIHRTPCCTFLPPPVDGKEDVSFFYNTYAIVGVGMYVSLFAPWLPISFRGLLRDLQIISRSGLLELVWTVLIPRWKGYVLEEKIEILKDGTSISNWSSRKYDTYFLQCLSVGTCVGRFFPLISVKVD
ncbi:hypothetical protein PABG_11797 [Paracoccidioides brasiliensis Pb03]|nr:hypothetical protein PABG_11797 [Paracoccidioides brasiliensis Pb03]